MQIYTKQRYNSKIDITNITQYITEALYTIYGMVTKNYIITVFGQ